MTVTPEKLVAYSERQRLVMERVIGALNDIPVDESLDTTENPMLAVDGLVGAMALIAEGSDLFPQLRDKRKFAENVRVAMLKSMKEARGMLDGGQFVRKSSNEITN